MKKKRTTKSLIDLAPKFDTDKGWPRHGYMEIYDMLFDRPRRLLELGIWRGESLRLWVAAFPGCDVHGVDVLNASVNGATTYQGDAYTLEMIAELPGSFDIIIDDGPHTLESQLFVAEHYIKLLSPGGVLVIEDVLMPEYVALLADAVPDEMKRGIFAIDRRHVPGVTSDSLMFVVRREP